MALGDYSPTAWVNGTAPAISASNLLNIENKVAELDTMAGTLVGSVTMYAGASAPTGWLLCNGQAVSRTTYSALFSAIGTTWGTGDGSTTFNVPDLRGAAPAGVGTSTGYTQNETLSLATKYNDQSQGWQLGATISGEKYGELQSVGSSVAATSNAGFALPQFNASLQGGAARLTAKSDGTNGTPRTGTTTRGKLVGINFIIRY